MSFPCSSSCKCDGNQSDPQSHERELPRIAYEGKPYTDWVNCLFDLSESFRLHAIEAIDAFSTANPFYYPFPEMCRLLHDKVEKVRVASANYLVDHAASPIVTGHVIRTAVQDNRLPQEWGDRVPTGHEACLDSISDEPIDASPEVITWGALVVALAQAVVAWAATRTLNRLYGNGLNLPETTSAAAYDLRGVLRSALDEAELRRCTADTTSLSDDLRTYLNTTPYKLELLTPVLTKASQTTRRLQGLGVTGVGCFSISANLRLLALQELVQRFGGSRPQLKSEITEYSNYIESQYATMQQHVNQRLHQQSDSCSRFEGSIGFGPCSMFYYIDGQRQHVHANDIRCDMFPEPGTISCYCYPLLEPPPGNCIDQMCFDDRARRRTELLTDLEQRLSALRDTVTNWRNTDVNRTEFRD